MSTKNSELIKQLRVRKNAITTSAELSDEGKRNQLTLLRTEIAAGRMLALDELSKNWGDVRKRFITLTERRQRAAEAEAQGWDYARLRFATEQAERAVENARSLSNPLQGENAGAYLRRQYAAAAHQGDRYALRAWGEVADRITALYGAEEASLAREMKSKLSELTQTLALTEIAEQEQLLVAQARELQRETLAARDFYDGELGIYSTGPFVVNSEFTDTMGDIRVTERYVPPQAEGQESATTPRMVTTLDVPIDN